MAHRTTTRLLRAAALLRARAPIIPVPCAALLGARTPIARALRLGARTSAARVMRVAPLAGALALLHAQSAAAASLTVSGTCYASGQQVALAGTTFTPLAAVAIGGAVTATAQADATGAFRIAIAAPPVAELGPRPMTITAVDGANPANAATLRLNVVHAAYGSNLPIAGRPHDMTTWRFAGFAPSRPIYAHFLLDGHARGDHRFGTARGECGTLEVRAPRIPGVRSLAPGHWTLKLDQRRTYRESTPGSEVSFRIMRRARDDGRDRGGGDDDGGRSAR